MLAWRMQVYFLATTVSGLAVASPPVDVTHPEQLRPGTVKKYRIKESDFEMMDVNDPQPDFDKETAEVVFDVIGRVKPTREGRPVLRCIKYDRIRFLKLSQDSRWAAIQSLRSGRKAWIPVTALDNIPIKKPEKVLPAKPAQ